jgi:DNA-directed RNA polymerase subunit K/omega
MRKGRAFAGCVRDPNDDTRPDEDSQMTKLASLIPPPGSNKYELAIIAAREARRLNDVARRTGDVVGAKVTALALERVIRGEVPFDYDDTR